MTFGSRNSAFVSSASAGATFEELVSEKSSSALQAIKECLYRKTEVAVRVMLAALIRDVRCKIEGRPVKRLGFSTVFRYAHQTTQ